MLFRFLIVFSMLYTTSCVAQSLNVFNPQAITVAIDKTPVSFNPYANQNAMSLQFKHLFYDPLLRWGTNNKLQARLVKSWKWIDKKTIRFYLRDNIHFHSGNLLTAKDVDWSWQQARKNSETYFLNEIDSLTVRHNNSFDIRSSLSEQQLLDYLTHLFILDSDFYKTTVNLLDTTPSIILPPVTTLPLSGTGPYLVQQYNPMLGIVVVANPHYWAEQAQIKYIRFMRINKPQSRLFALLAGDVQVSYGIPNKEAKELDENTNKKLVKVPSSNIIFLSINDKLSPVLNENNARKALHLAINQAGMLKYILKSNGKILPIIMSEETHNASKKQKMPEYNLEKSKALLKNLKLPKQLSLLVLLDEAGNNRTVAAAVTKMLKAVDIQVVTQEVSSEDIWVNTNLYYDLTIANWQTRLSNLDNVDQALFLKSPLTTYLQDKFKQQGIDNNVKSQFKYFEFLQENNWVIPLFYQDDIWAQSEKFNLQEIFSSNGIPYWSLFKAKDNQTEIE